VANSVSQLK